MADQSNPEKLVKLVEAVDKKLTELTGRVNTLDTQMREMQNSVSDTGLTNKVQTLDTQMHEVVNRLDEVESHLSKLSSGASHPPAPDSSRGDLPEDSVCVTPFDTTTGRIVQPKSGATLKLDGTEVPLRTHKGKSYVSAKDLPTPGPATLQVGSFQDTNCVSYGGPLIYFQVPTTGPLCCCLPLPVTPEVGTCTITVAAYNTATKEGLDDVDVIATPISPIATAGQGIVRSTSPIAAKTVNGKAELFGVPQNQLIQIQVRKAGFSSDPPGLQYHYVCCESTRALEFSFTPCPVDAEFTLIVVNGDSCKGTRVPYLPVSFEGQQPPHTTDSDGIITFSPVPPKPFPISSVNWTLTPSTIQPQPGGAVVVTATQQLLSKSAAHPAHRDLDDDPDNFVLHSDDPDAVVEVFTPAGEHIAFLHRDASGSFRYPTQPYPEMIFALLVNGVERERILLKA